jgi:hypothetical protein
MNRFSSWSLPFLLAIASSYVHAVQPGAPIPEEATFRVTIDPYLSTDFYGLNRAELHVDFTHKIGAGFDWGFTVHGGAAGKSLLASDPVNGIAGLDLMARYLGRVDKNFFFGLQLEGLYTHNFANAAKFGALGLRLSLPIVAHFENAVALYASPHLQFEGLVTDTTNFPASSFGPGLGAGLALGLMIYTDGPGIFIQARPNWLDVRKPGAVSADFSLGVAIQI